MEKKAQPAENMEMYSIEKQNFKQQESPAINNRIHRKYMTNTF